MVTKLNGNFEARTSDINLEDPSLDDIAYIFDELVNGEEIDVNIDSATLTAHIETLNTEEGDPTGLKNTGDNINIILHTNDGKKVTIKKELYVPSGQRGAGTSITDHVFSSKTFLKINKVEESPTQDSSNISLSGEVGAEIKDVRDNTLLKRF